MFQITPEVLLEKSTPLTVRRGSDYFRENRIKSIQFNQEKLSFDASVLGTRHYNIHVHFAADGKLNDVSCTCSDFEKNYGYCKHIVAVLLFIRDREKQGFFSELKFRQAAKHIFSFFQNRADGARLPVTLEYTLELGKGEMPGSGTFCALRLRMGDEKLYIVRNARKLFECMEAGEELEFGKKFVFDPAVYGFSEEDKPIVDLLREVYEAGKLIDKLSGGYNRASLFRDDRVFLTDGYIRRFLELIGSRSIRVLINKTLYDDVTICNEDIPVEFDLTKQGNDLLLNIDFEGSLVPLTEDGEYFFANGRIYKVSRQQRDNFKPFYLAMLYQKGRKLRFIEGDKERFVSEILPFAEKAGKLSISENVQSLIERLPLEAEIYIDRSGDSIVAETRFCYGGRVINPFAHMERPEYATDKILIRDIEKEGDILDILGESDFKVRNGRIYLSEGDNVYDFVFKVIPKLQEYAAVYYSDSFRNLTVRQHMNFTSRIRFNLKTDMLEFDFNMDGIERSELIDILNSLKEKKKYFQLKSGAFLMLDSKEVQDVSNFIERMDLEGKDLRDELVEVPKYMAPYMDEYIRSSGLSFVERNHAFKELVQNIREPADMEFDIPKELTAVLREYQKFGFKWLKTLSVYGMGGILADDMGLGKTLQVIALVLSERLERGVHPSLVVVPTSLVYNWCAEVEKFAPCLKVTAVSGSREERQKQMEDIAQSDLVITSYPLIRRDIDDYRGLVFRYCILDEAQYIKNPDSLNAKSVKSINAERRFALTGTPVENSLTELWSIFDFILPGYMFSHTRFVQRYEAPIARGEGRKELEELGRQIRPFILRRLKTDVLSELPEKIENKMVAELTDEQRKVYLAYLQKAKEEVEKEIKENGFERSQLKILAALTRLRQICCHPSVFLQDYQGESGKMLLLEEVLMDTMESGHRILLFSQFTSMLAIIRGWLDSEDIDYMYLDGSTPSEERTWLVKDFNAGKGKIFLISLKAGGTGLNLTGADTVIHYDPWWNPAVEDQATDRAYRIGQKKSVHVMKLITRGTIEERIFELQQRKKKLVDAVIQPGETLLTKLSREEIQSLFE